MKPASAARHTPLDGITLVVTRPALTADAQVRAARLLGAQVLRLPGLALAAVDDAAGARAALAAAAAADAWIFTSPAGVRFAFALLPQWRPHAQADVFAVGRATARALARHAIAARVPVERQDSEGLLALEAFATARGRKIVIIDAPGGRDVIASSLRQRGAEVERIAVYRRAPARLGARHLRALEEAPRPWITLVSSGEALANLLDALPADVVTGWRTQPLVVSSGRLAEHAREAGFSDIHVARSALTRDLLTCACSVRKHR